MVEDYTLTEVALDECDVLDIDIEKYHPYYPGVPLSGGGPVIFTPVRKSWQEHYVNCPHCKERLGRDRHVERVLLRFKIEQKAGRCPKCKTILYDYRDEHAEE
ncbi:hypothetical protein H8E77_02020, partial [bacterium]|nr:hypothetical protein [bacterium]